MPDSYEKTISVSGMELDAGVGLVVVGVDNLPHSV